MAGKIGTNTRQAPVQTEVFLSQRYYLSERFQCEGVGRRDKLFMHELLHCILAHSSMTSSMGSLNVRGWIAGTSCRSFLAFLALKHGQCHVCTELSSLRQSLTLEQMEEQLSSLEAQVRHSSVLAWVIPSSPGQAQLTIQSCSLWILLIFGGPGL